MTKSNRATLIFAVVLTAIFSAGPSSAEPSNKNVSQADAPAAANAPIEANKTIPSKMFSSDGCNSTSYSQIFAKDVTSGAASTGNLFLGRRIQNTSSDPCSGQNMSVALFEMNWTTRQLITKSLLAKPPFAVQGKRIVSAYDPTYLNYKGEHWMAFECASPDLISVGTCMGPFDITTGLDLNRTSIVITPGRASDGSSLSASVPKLLNFKDRIYLYWSVVRISPTGPWVNVTTRGVELVKDTRGKMGFWAKGATDSIAANDTRTNEVFGLDSGDVRSDKVADAFQMSVIDDNVVMTAARGGGKCLTPLDPGSGCYRMVIAKSSSPLGERIFNLDLLPESRLPNNRNEYARFVFDPTTGVTSILGMFFAQTTDPNPTLKQAGLQAFSSPLDSAWLSQGPGTCGVGRKSPDWGMKNGQCLASCGGIGGTAAFQDKCENHKMRSVGTAYDVPFCCAK